MKATPLVLNHTERLFIESDTLLGVNSFTSHSIDIFYLGALISDFLSIIDRDSTSFSHVKSAGNIHVHVLVRVALDSEEYPEWSILMPPHIVSQCYSFLF